MRRMIIAVLLFCAIATKGQAQQPDNYRSPQDWVMAKNYLASFLLYQDSLLSKQLADDPKIAQILARRHERYQNSKNCRDVACVVEAFKWLPSEIDELAGLMEKLAERNEQLEGLIVRKLLPSLAYGLPGEASPSSYFGKAMDHTELLGSK